MYVGFWPKKEKLRRLDEMRSEACRQQVGFALIDDGSCVSLLSITVEKVYGTGSLVMIMVVVDDKCGCWLLWLEGRKEGRKEEERRRRRKSVKNCLRREPTTTRVLSLKLN